VLRAVRVRRCRRGAEPQLRRPPTQRPVGLASPEVSGPGLRGSFPLQKGRPTPSILRPAFVSPLPKHPLCAITVGCTERTHVYFFVHFLSIVFMSRKHRAGCLGLSRCWGGVLTEFDVANVRGRSLFRALFPPTGAGLTEAPLRRRSGSSGVGDRIFRRRRCARDLPHFFGLFGAGFPPRLLFKTSNPGGDGSDMNQFFGPPFFVFTGPPLGGGVPRPWVAASHPDP